VKLEFSLQIFEKYKYQIMRKDRQADRQTDRRTNMTKLMVVYCNFANALKNW